MKPYKILLFILSVVLMLALISYSFPEEGVPLMGRELYFPSITDVLTKEKDEASSGSERMDELEEELRLQRDSLAMAYQDSLSFYTNFFKTSPVRISLPDNDWDFFNDLFADLEASREKKEVIHILHYGDSQIEGDRITGYIRQRLQETFGGNGPGLLPAVQPIPSAAVAQSMSGGIARYIVSGSHVNRASHRRYGVLGQMGQMSGEASVSISSRNWKNTFENTKEFSKIRLFVGRTSDKFKANLIIPKMEGMVRSVEDTSAVHALSWDLESPIKKFTLRMTGSAEIYGIAVDGESGVAMDNVPFRGSSGTFFSTLDSTVMSCMFQQLNTRLILLEFGGNMMPVMKSDKVVADYKAKMAAQIAYLRAVCPEAKIILIGPADMSTKVKGKLQTYPYLVEVTEALKAAALENGVAFWNMFEVMGGENSMKSWVTSKPALAAPDYIHFTPRGADKIADMFCESLMMYYDYYQFRKEKNEDE